MVRRPRKVSAVPSDVSTSGVDQTLLTEDVHAPLLPRSGGAWNTWPKLTDLFPWQESGLQFKRTWPIAEDKETLERRWKALLASEDRAAALKSTGQIHLGTAARAFDAPYNSLPTIGSLPSSARPPAAVPYGYRGFDQRWAMVDPRLGDRLRPELRAAHGQHQTYLISFLTEQLGEGPAAVASAALPDLHYFRGSFGGKHVIPLWRDAAARTPNVGDGLLETIGDALGQVVSAEDLFAYCYAILAGPAYVETFTEELTIPGPRIPITRNPKLFDVAAAIGRKLLFLHTHGERFVPNDQRTGRIPAGTAKCAQGTSSDPAEYPESFGYDAAKHELRVGDGLFTNVSQEVYDFAVSGYKVVQRWLDGRMRERSGRKSSPLDDIRPQSWTFDEDLLSLLWVLEHTIAKYPEHTKLLARIIDDDCVTAAEIAEPTFENRAGPRPTRHGNTVQETLKL